MAKKKNRQLNIAHKRAKRQREQKSRHKQLTVRKQRLLQNTKSDEERLQDKIVKSRLLIDEPEFEDVTFDPDLLRQHVLQLLESQLSSLKAGDANAVGIAHLLHLGQDAASDSRADEASEIELIPEDEEEHEAMGEKFRCDVLPLLITPDFLRTMTHALRACETRLKLMGYRDKAEVAFVARSLFEIADPDTLIFHPLILKICARTLERVLTQPQFMREERDAVQNVLSDVLRLSQTKESVDEQDSMDEESVEGPEESHQEELDEPEEELTDEVAPMLDVPTVSLEDLPAKALYKNFSLLETRHAIEVGNGYRIVKDTEQQVEFVHTEHQRYITLTADRLLLQCPSKAQLEVAMKEVEEWCGQSVFYLAKTVDGE